LTGAPASGGAQRVMVKNTQITDMSGEGIRAANSNAVGVQVFLQGVQISNTSAGLTLSTNARGIAVDSQFVNHTGSAVEVLSGSPGVDLHNCVLAGAVTGLALAAGTSRISNCTITNNTNGVNFVGGTLVTYGDNKTQGNTNEAIGGAIPGPTGKK
jgi:hypothetical protein